MRDISKTLADFKIGMAFTNGTRLFRCTDVGTRTITALYLDPEKIATVRVVNGIIGEEVQSMIDPRIDTSWHNGPPYACAEVVIDENDFDGLIDFVPEDEVLKWKPIQEHEQITPESHVELRPQVVILNGIGSVGKTSTAKALQAITSKPFLHVAMDAFLDMLPDKMLSHPDGLLFEPSEEDGKPVVAIHSGPVLDRTMRGMRHAVAAMAKQCNNLIIDEVVTKPQTVREYRHLLQDCDLHIVGLIAPLDVLEARERARGDREIGLARWQHGRVHLDITYDLEVDTAVASPAECARLIRDAFDL